jgi:nucleoid-associated protein YgaU
MGLETRIGIVTGLVIVVVASIYFFYGNRGVDDDILLTTAAPAAAGPTAVGQKATPALRIPPSNETRTAGPAPSAPRLSPPVEPTSPSPGRPVVGQAAAERTVPAHPPTEAPQGAGPTAAVTLRTGPASSLVEATRDNLDDDELEPVSSLAELDGQTLSASPQALTRAVPERATPISLPREIAPVSPRPVAPMVRHHTIETGDTLEGLARTYYGDIRKLGLILAANPGLKDPRQLKIGTVVVVPEDASATRPHHAAALPAAAEDPGRAAAQPEGKTYRVQEGDTFYRIAARQLGSSSRWEELYELNRGLVRDDPRRLRPGMVIRLPQ